jgi:Secretory lipase
VVRNRGRLARRIRLLAGCLAGASWLGLAAPALAVDKPSADPFYSYDPAAIAAASPGTVLKSRAISVPTRGVLPGSDVPGTQALYRTQNQLGQPTATAATIIPPPASGAPPPTKLLSYQTFYDGLDDSCRPSYTLQGGVPATGSGDADNNLLLGYVRDGYTVVSSDYEGPADDYTAGHESGYGTLDGIRAAEAKLSLPSSSPVGLVGYSGGSIASDWASELSPSYAPELNVLGVAEGGIPVDYAHMFAYINGSTAWAGVIPAVTLGLFRAYQLDPTQYFNATGQQILGEVAKGCLTAGAYPGLHFEDMLKQQYRDWQQVPELAGIFHDAIMGAIGTPKEPLFMAVGNADGNGDGVMPAGDVTALARTYCQRGVSVQLHTYTGSDHIASIALFDSDARQFMQQRYAGAMPANECASIGPVNPLTPLPVPSSTPAQPSSGSSLSAVRHRKCRKPHHKDRRDRRACRKQGRRPQASARLQRLPRARADRAQR